MRVLLTGDAGNVGRVVGPSLAADGFDVVGFDVARGQDLFDQDALRTAIDGCDAVVHCAAVNNDASGTPPDIFATNVTGTWLVLQAAGSAGIDRVVSFSSMQALGIAEAEQPPAHFPIDDAHPRLAGRPYGLSKCFGEDLCAAATRRTGMTTTSRRPAGTCRTCDVENDAVLLQVPAWVG